MVLSCGVGTVTPEDPNSRHGNNNGPRTLPTDWHASHVNVVWLHNNAILISDLSAAVASGNNKQQEAGDNGGGNGRFKLAATGDLQMFNVRKSDAGKYTCRVSNDAGHATASAFLAVTGEYVRKLWYCKEIKLVVRYFVVKVKYSIDHESYYTQASLHSDIVGRLTKDASLNSHMVLVWCES